MRVFRKLISINGRFYNSLLLGNIRIQHVFVILVAIMGITYAFIIPPEQIADEHTHYLFIEQELGGEGFYAEIDQFYILSGAWDVRSSLTTQDTERLSECINLHFSSECKFIGTPSITLIRHLPMTIGFLLGAGFGAPIFVCLMLAELFGLLFFIVMGYIALKIIPVHKELLMAIMLLPMTVSQCSSVNYDAVLLPVAFVFCAFWLDCIVGKRIITWKSLLFVCLCIFVMILVKIPYIAMILLLFMVPRDKWNLKIGRLNIIDFLIKYWYCFVILIVIVTMIGLYYFRGNKDVQIIIAAGLNPLHFIGIIKNTFQEYVIFYGKTTIGVFGWLDTYMPTIFYIVVTLFILIISQAQNDMKISAKKRIITEVIGMICLLTIVIALISWSFTLYGYTNPGTVSDAIALFNEVKYSLGVQGRYFLPLMLPILIPICGLLKIKKQNLVVLQCVYYPVIYIWTLIVLLERYWI